MFMFVCVLARDHLVRGLDDGLGLLRIEHLEIQVDLRRGALHLRQRLDQRQRHLLGADLEVGQRTLRLRAPQPVGGDLDRAERVLLDAGGHARLRAAR
jgi:hypothetical protein